MKLVAPAIGDALWAAVGLALGVALVFPPETVGDDLGLRRFLTPEITGGVRVAQRFVMDAPDLHAIEISAAAVGPVSGTVRLALRDARSGDVYASEEIPAQALVGDSVFVFRFAPQPVSFAREYRLEVTAAAENPSRGVALWATKGDRLADGGLLLNDRPRWASLAFQTRTPARAPIVAMLGGSGRPGHWLAFIALAGAWVALRFVLKAVAVPVDAVPSR